MPIAISSLDDGSGTEAVCLSWTYSVTSGGGKCVYFEHGVIRGNLLKGDVRVPTRASKPADVAELVREAAALLLLLAADDADLVAELAAFLCQGMDVKARRFGLVKYLAR
jgi:hypothetical protein